MGLGVCSGTQLYMRSKLQCDDSLPEKKRCLFISTTRAIRTRDRESKKVGSLKYFKVCGIQEKESQVDGLDLSSHRHSYLPEV
jgi:hypothetical protein